MTTIEVGWYACCRVRWVQPAAESRGPPPRRDAGEAWWGLVESLERVQGQKASGKHGTGYH